jgi:excisionase family DNA binding protein
MPSFHAYVKQRIRRVESWLALPPDETDWQQVAEDCRSVLAEVESQATLAGVPGAVTVCQGLGTNATVEETRRILAECLAACPEPSRDTLTPPEVAKQLSVSSDTVLAWIRSGELAAANIASRTSNRPRWIIKKTDLDRYLKGRQPETAAPPKKLESSFKRYST